VGVLILIENGMEIQIRTLTTEISTNNIFEYYCYSPLPYNYSVWIDWFKTDGDFVRKGEILGVFKVYLGIETSKSSGINLEPPKSFHNGYLKILKFSPKNFDSYEYIKNGDVLFLIRENKEQLAKIIEIEKLEKGKKSKLEKELRAKKNSIFIEESRLKAQKEKEIQRNFINVPRILDDEFSKHKIIKWEKIGGYIRDALYNDCINTESENMEKLLFAFNNIQSKDYIVFRFTNYDFRLKKGDNISFLFEDNSQIKFDVTSNTFKIKNYYPRTDFHEVRVQLRKNELDIFCSKSFVKWQIKFRDTDKIITMKQGVYPYGQISALQKVIKTMANDYIKLVKKEIVNYKPLIDSDYSVKKVTEENEECYLYLMIDYTNNYHKIGISNNPDFREKTLQSEKPTIELLCTKKFPNRKIASILEKTLHKTYSQNRVRGEWFNLNEIEVEEIKLTIS